MERLLEVKDLNVTYKVKKNRVYAVEHAAFDLDEGESLGIVGESGSGKSTLATALLRLHAERVTDISGQALFRGRDLFSLSKDEMNAVRWKQLAVVFQKSMNAFSPVHRIGEQIADIYRIHEPGASEEQALTRAGELLEMVNLGKRIFAMYPHEMSGGMLQRVVIAVSLLHEPDLLILDEATTALDVITQGQILSELRSMEKRLHTSRIIITHDMSVVAVSCSRVVVMYAGRIVETGPVETILQNPAHPYTDGLIASYPPLKGERTRLTSIPGHLPDMTVRHEGCIFAPRCPKKRECCGSPVPLKELSAGHTVSCHLAGGAQ